MSIDYRFPVGPVTTRFSVWKNRCSWWYDTRSSSSTTCCWSSLASFSRLLESLFTSMVTNVDAVLAEAALGPLSQLE